MKDDDALPVSTPTAHISSSSSSSNTTSFKREGSAVLGLFGRGRYKFWALAAILLLAFWSMFTGTVTLRWSAGNLDRFDHHLDSALHNDLDVLEIEEREKLVKHMWDVYTNSKRLKLPKFWQQAFEAAYEGLTGDDPQVREDAFSEIAKMSLHYINLELPHSHSATSIIHEKVTGAAQSNEFDKD